MAAEFTINGTAFDTLEYEAEHDEVLTFALEEAPGFDVSSVTYSVLLASDDAPALTFSPSSGSPTTPTGNVTVTMPSSGAHSYRVQCQVNNGYDGSGRWNSAYTRERIVSIRSANLGMRKLVPGETTQAHASGWTVAQNEMVDILESTGGGGGGGGVVVSAEAPLDIDAGVLSIDAASAVARGTMSAAHFQIVEALGNVDQEPTAETIVQRGPAAEVKASYIEVGIEGGWPEVGDIRGGESFSIYAPTPSGDARVLTAHYGTSTLIIGDQDYLTPEIRSPSGNGVRFRHAGALTTYFHPLATGTCSAVGDIRLDATTGQLYFYKSGTGEVAAAVGNSSWDVHFYAVGVGVSGGVRYIAPASNTTGGNTTPIQWSSRACRIVRIGMANVSATPAATGSWTGAVYTVLSDVGTITGLSLTVAANARSGSTTGSVSIADGTLLAFGISGNGSNQFSNAVWTVTFEGV